MMDDRVRYGDDNDSQSNVRVDDAERECALGELADVRRARQLGIDE
jgi:hypothetical protein